MTTHFDPSSNYIHHRRPISILVRGRNSSNRSAGRAGQIRRELTPAERVIRCPPLPMPRRRPAHRSDSSADLGMTAYVILREARRPKDLPPGRRRFFAALRMTGAVPRMRGAAPQNDRGVIQPCHPEGASATEGSPRPVGDALAIQSPAKSFHSGFLVSINATFFDRRQPLIFFSPSMACSTSSNSSNHTSFVMLYLLVKPRMSLFLC